MLLTIFFISIFPANSNDKNGAIQVQQTREQTENSAEKCDSISDPLPDLETILNRRNRIQLGSYIQSFNKTDTDYMVRSVLDCIFNNGLSHECFQNPLINREKPSTLSLLQKLIKSMEVNRLAELNMYKLFKYLAENISFVQESSRCPLTDFLIKFFQLIQEEQDETGEPGKDVQTKYKMLLSLYEDFHISDSHLENPILKCELRYGKILNLDELAVSSRFSDNFCAFLSKGLDSIVDKENEKFQTIRGGQNKYELRSFIVAEKGNFFSIVNFPDGWYLICPKGVYLIKESDVFFLLRRNVRVAFYKKHADL